jgi:hypothetical protein
LLCTFHSQSHYTHLGTYLIGTQKWAAKAVETPLDVPEVKQEGEGFQLIFEILGLRVNCVPVSTCDLLYTTDELGRCKLGNEDKSWTTGR